MNYTVQAVGFENQSGRISIEKDKVEIQLILPKITGISMNCDSPIKIFPNPSSEYIYLSTEQAVQVELYDVSGNFIWKKQVHRIPVSDLKKGMFFLSIKTLDGEFIGSHKIVVN